MLTISYNSWHFKLATLFVFSKNRYIEKLNTCSYIRSLIISSIILVAFTFVVMILTVLPLYSLWVSYSAGYGIHISEYLKHYADPWAALGQFVLCIEFVFACLFLLVALIFGVFLISKRYLPKITKTINKTLGTTSSFNTLTTILKTKHNKICAKVEVSEIPYNTGYY